MPVKDLRSQRFGRLVVQGLHGKDRKGSVVWECTCDCGATHRVVGDILRRGAARSCGCLRRETAGARLRTLHEQRKERHDQVV